MSTPEDVMVKISLIDLDILSSERTDSDGISAVDRMILRKSISSLHPKNHALDVSIEKLERDRLMSTIKSTPIRRPGVLEAVEVILCCPRIMEYSRLTEWYRRDENTRDKPIAYLSRRISSLKERIKDYAKRNLDMEFCESDLEVALEFTLTRNKG